jgi:hypothetical protein
MNNFNNYENDINLLLKSLNEIATQFNYTTSIEITTAYIAQFNDDLNGIFVKLSPSDDAGMFIALNGFGTTNFNTYRPKLDDGDSSVGLSAHYYNSFDEDHDYDFTTTSLLDSALKSFLALVEFDLKPRIDNLLEHESLQLLDESEGEH